MENFHELLINRRTIRRYTQQPVNPDQVKLIMEAALMSPSSKSVRPWQFVVVEEKEMLERLSHCKPNYATSIASAPLAIVVTADITKSDAWIEENLLPEQFFGVDGLALLILVSNRDDTQHGELLGYSQHLPHILLGGDSVLPETLAYLDPATAKTEILGLQLHQHRRDGGIFNPCV